MGKENNTLQNTDNLSGFHHLFSAADWTWTNGGEHLHARRRLMAVMFTSAITDSCGMGWMNDGTQKWLSVCTGGCACAF